jgi:hypothetical protein
MKALNILIASTLSQKTTAEVVLVDDRCRLRPICGELLCNTYYYVTHSGGLGKADAIGFSISKNNNNNVNNNTNNNHKLLWYAYKIE